MEKNFDGKRKRTLGTKAKPAAVTVKTEKRKKEVESEFKKNGWEFSIEIDPDKPEDIMDLEALQNKPEPITIEKKTGRNDPCSCGSGKKFKKCCGA